MPEVNVFDFWGASSSSEGASSKSSLAELTLSMSVSKWLWIFLSMPLGVGGILEVSALARSLGKFGIGSGVVGLGPVRYMTG